MKLIIRTVLLVIYLLLSGSALHAENQDPPRERHILLLNSYHKGYSWTDGITHGVEETLMKEGVDLHIEYMDTKRQFDTAYQSLMADLLTLKHRNHGYDVVIASDNNAFDFLKERGEKIFGTTPVVFCGVNHLQRSEIKGLSRFTGVNEQADLGANLALIQRLHPERNKVVVVTDNTTTGKRIQEETKKLRPMAENMGIRMDLVYDVTITGLIKTLRGLNHGTVVLYTFFFRDRNGKFLEFDRAAQLVCDNSPVPVYGVWNFNLGLGIVGGHVICGCDQGSAAAKKALAILSGSKVVDIPVLWESPTRLRFDFRQLQRFNIPLSALPGESEILFRPPSFYREHKALVWNMALVLTMMTLALVGVIYSLLRSQRAEEKLKRARNYISNIIDSMPSVLIGVDRDGKVTQWNLTAKTITGIEATDARGKSLAHVFPRMVQEMKKIEESITTRQIKKDKKMPRPSEQGICYDHVTIYPLVANGVEGAVIRIDDITDQVRMEEMMIQSEKMLSVGGLAAGMAHEINNPLAGMIQTANVMANRLTSDTMPANLAAAAKAGTSMEAIRAFMETREIPRMITAIKESGSRVAEIVNNMLSFARKGDTRRSPQDMAELMDKTLELASTDYDLKKKYDFRQIEIVKNYQKNLPKVVCEGSKIQQVLLNILTNGAQAMQEKREKKPRFTLSLTHDKEGDRVCIKIEDNGPGMVEEVRTRVFEPFFTTKPEGVGTGLGLSVSYFIITENHGGTMKVESEPGKGTKFIIHLPRGQA